MSTRLASLMMMAGLGAAAATADPTAPHPPSLAEFTHHGSADWINSAPLTAAKLRGQPLLIEVWTFDCSNCLASMAWMRRINDLYGSRGLGIVAVHTPELTRERDAGEVRRAVARLGIIYPVMIDSDYSYWRVLDNRYWPAFYLYDGAGRLLEAQVGEMRSEQPRAAQFERRIAAALEAAEGYAPRSKPARHADRSTAGSGEVK